MIPMPSCEASFSSSSSEALDEDRASPDEDPIQTWATESRPGEARAVVPTFALALDEDSGFADAPPFSLAEVEVEASASGLLPLVSLDADVGVVAVSNADADADAREGSAGSPR